MKDVYPHWTVHFIRNVEPTISVDTLYCQHLSYSFKNIHTNVYWERERKRGKKKMVVEQQRASMCVAFITEFSWVSFINFEALWLILKFCSKLGTYRRFSMTACLYATQNFKKYHLKMRQGFQSNRGEFIDFAAIFFLISVCSGSLEIYRYRIHRCHS